MSKNWSIAGQHTNLHKVAFWQCPTEMGTSNFSWGLGVVWGY